MRARPTAIHICIVHYNTGALTAKLVRQLGEQAHTATSDIYIHLLDNASEARHRAPVQEAVAMLPNASLLFSTRNLGFGAGINRIVSTIEPQQDDLIWILNPDVEIHGTVIDALEYAVLSTEFSIVSPVIVTGRRDAPVIWYAGGDINERKVAVRHHDAGRRVQGVAPESFATGFITGAAPMMLRSTFDRLGGFADGYFLYWEDVDLSARAGQKDI